MISKLSGRSPSPAAPRTAQKPSQPPPAQPARARVAESRFERPVGIVPDARVRKPTVQSSFERPVGIVPDARARKPVVLGGFERPVGIVPDGRTPALPAFRAGSVERPVGIVPDGRTPGLGTPSRAGRPVGIVPDNRLPGFTAPTVAQQLKIASIASKLEAGALDTGLASPRGTGVAALRGGDEEKVEGAFDFVQATLGTGLANALAEDSRLNLNEAERNELIRQVLRSDRPADILLSYQLAEPRNLAYDDAQAVATAVQEAYAAGDVTPADLEELTENLTPEEAAEVALLLAQDPANVGPGGVVEAFGLAAEEAGHDQAAALALTSSQALIDAHYPTDSAQREAFEHVNGFLEENQDRAEAAPGGAFRAFYSVAAGNAARLTANGNGFSDEEFSEFVEDLGPSLANEVIARATAVPGDTAADGAVELLGKTSAEIAEDADGDDKTQWEVNSAIAFTSSDELIARNLDSAPLRERAFAVLTEQLNALRGEVGEARGNYGLLEHPALVDGATRLFEAHGQEFIDRAVEGSPEDAAELSSFLQDTLYSLDASPEARERVQRTVEGYANTAIANAGNDSAVVGEKVGRLLGIVQISAEEAIQRAGEAGSEQSDLARQVAIEAGAAVGATIATTLVGFLTANPLVGAAVGAATRTILKDVFGIDNPSQDPAELQEQLEDAFRSQLEEGGVNPSFGEEYVENLREVANAVLQDLNQAISELPHDDPRRAELEHQANLLRDIKDSVNLAYLAYTGYQSRIREAIEANG